MNTVLPEAFDPTAQIGNVYDLIPPGDYTAQIIDANVAPPKTGDGYMLTLVWKITEGEHENRQVWQYVVFLHSKEQTVTIGRRTLTDLCNAVDIHTSISDAAEFLFKLARIRVAIKKDPNGHYGDANRVTRIMPLARTGPAPSPTPAATPKPAASAPTSSAAARPGPVGTAPWHDNR
jgi:hypothetical protein